MAKEWKPGGKKNDTSVPKPPTVPPVSKPRWQKPDPARSAARQQRQEELIPRIEDPADPQATRILETSNREPGEQRDFFYFDTSLDGRLDQINATIATRREELKQGISDEALIRLRTDIQQLLIELQPISDRLQEDAETIQAHLWGSESADDNNARAIKIPKEYAIIIAQNRKMYETMRALRVQFENVQRLRGEIGNTVGERRPKRSEEYIVPGDADEDATRVMRVAPERKKWQPSVPGTSDWDSGEDAHAKMFRRNPDGSIEWIEPGQPQREQATSHPGMVDVSLQRRAMEIGVMPSPPQAEKPGFWDRIGLGGLFGKKKKK